MLDDVLHLVLAGDEGAFEFVVREFLPVMRQRARRELNEHDVRGGPDSADVCQEVFLQFFQRVRGGKIRVEDAQHLGYLLLKMVHADVVRSARWERAARRDVRRRANESVESLELASSEWQPLRDDEATERAKRLLAELTVYEAWLCQQRGEDKTWQEIAAGQDASADALRIRYARILVKFRHAMRRKESIGSEREPPAKSMAKT